MKKEKGIVFTFDGGPLKNIKTAWNASLRRAGLRPLRSHDLRHTANTRLMLAGVMQEVRRELIGHSSQHSRDVNDRYAHVGLHDKRDAMRKLELWLEAEVCRLDESESAPTERRRPNRSITPRRGP